MEAARRGAARRGGREDDLGGAGRKNEERGTRNKKKLEEKKRDGRGEVALCGLSRAYVISDSTSEGAGPAIVLVVVRVVGKQDGKRRGDPIETKTKDLEACGRRGRSHG